MQGKGRRAKGQRGERELFKLILEKTGIKLERNLQQTKNGGADAIGLDWLSLEVKYQEKENLSLWWNQTKRQTKKGQMPALAFRANRKQWKFMVEGDYRVYGLNYEGFLGILNVDDFCSLIKKIDQRKKGKGK